MSGSLALVLETSTPHASIARVGPDGHVDQREFAGDRNHNARLFAPLDELLHAVPTSQIGLVLVGSGPGSYSGTRVGIAAAQGVAIALACPAVAVPSVLATPSAATARACWAIGDARRGGFWAARVDDCHLTEDPSLCDAATMVAIVEAAAAQEIPVITFEDVGRFPLPAELGHWVRQEFPDAIRLWQAWQRADASTRRAWSAAIPQPLYLKPPHITAAKRAPLLPK